MQALAHRLKPIAAATLAFGLALPAMAQTAGSHVVSVGALRYQPNDSSDPLNITNVPAAAGGGPQAGSGFTISAETTLAFTYEYFITDNIGIEVLGGVPPKHTLKGTGTLGADAINPLATVRQYSVPVLLRWHFNEPTDRFRPYVGLGAAYTWFDEIRITPQFQQALSLKLTRGASGAGVTTASVDGRLKPVFNVGATYAFDKNWGAIASVSYMPLDATAKLTTTLPTGAVVRSEGKLDINPVIMYLGVTRTF
ncbi:OmpW/AlkL family protein [Derxia gummosa]|uniref:OmpW/AlkL family protein n=1 Tax=Derxia gummosa DSM 723 TaxID=1121388 RepID=A0A8B6X0Z1_9BURK|nr:OmpW family outer membrane protein [Derxia gummosa]